MAKYILYKITPFEHGWFVLEITKQSHVGSVFGSCRGDKTWRYNDGVILSSDESCTTLGMSEMGAFRLPTFRVQTASAPRGMPPVVLDAAHLDRVVEALDRYNVEGLGFNNDDFEWRTTVKGCLYFDPASGFITCMSPGTRALCPKAGIRPQLPIQHMLLLDTIEELIKFTEDLIRSNYASTSDLFATRMKHPALEAARNILREYSHDL